MVEGLPAAVVEDGLTVEQIQTDVEVRLRKAGIRVFDSKTSGAYLYINAHLVKGKGSIAGIYADNLDVTLEQPVVVLSNGALAVSATWSVASAGTVGRANLRDVRDVLADLVDEFINAFLAVNPR